MRKKYISVISMILVFALLCSATLRASAEELYLGTSEDITGYIIPDTPGETCDTDGDTVVDQMPGDGNPVIFSIRANRVSYLLTSKTGEKSFTRDSLPDGAQRIICDINLDHSLANEEHLDGAVSAGVCYYGYSSLHQANIYISVFKSYVPFESMGVTYQTDFLIAGNLQFGKTYYSFVKNEYGAGYVYGTVTLYSSSSTD